MAQAATGQLHRFGDWLRALLLLGVLLALGGCAVQLAPPYDPQIEQRLVALDTETQAFFERMELGDARQRTYAANKDFYVELLAGLQTVRVLALTRPQPQGWLAGLGGVAARTVEQLNKAADEREAKAKDDKTLANISADILKAMIQSVRIMQSDQQAAPFEDGDIKTYRTLLGQQFTSLLRYERYLKGG
ncbi:hypothetical protein SAMN06265365_103112 [Tistlia consotensis]|uniref:Uncharacterized protein n=1 Tax=Tistlia consotensis USBA 355 TaxID=560819 RepID=A0A1Y6BLQ1_9PROT|nr:hypothetical protein [Tistlia consotensis]SMF17634.1 hypothetical protein SAMN05428998_106113 [Tistlia consotensis USBA 355]SNR40263.1 hypothetical protein SAMN06265365_103112 [Tistlia consotensis]